jgi:hypothetical protein
MHTLTTHDSHNLTCTNSKQAEEGGDAKKNFSETRAFPGLKAPEERAAERSFPGLGRTRQIAREHAIPRQPTRRAVNPPTHCRCEPSFLEVDGIL